jgi:hypothetical protein
MLPEYLWDSLSPYTRVTTAVLPFVGAIILRLLLGKSRASGWLVTLATAWFAANVLMAPFSANMQHEIRELGRMIE